MLLEASGFLPRFQLYLNTLADFYSIFLQSQKPYYWLGYGMGIGLTFAAVVSTFILRFAYSRANKKRDAMSEEEIRAKYTEEEILGKVSSSASENLLMFEDMGDKSPLYRYVI